MQSKLNPYISFKDNAREAMEFYKTVFGGKLELSTFAEGHMDDTHPNEGEKIMHGMLEAENGITFMAADTPGDAAYKTSSNISLSLSGDNEEELRGYWNKLIEGGQERQPLVKAPWGATFGMLTDKYGIEWMVNIAAKQE